MRETEITSLILDTYNRDFQDRLESDVVIAGAGPAGLTAAYYLSHKGIKTTIFEKKLSTGGGTWGGGAGCNVAVLEDTEILDEIEVRHEEQGDLVAVDSVELATALAYRALQAGTKIFNMIAVEDLVLKGGDLRGVVVNRTPIEMAGLHVDPICVGSDIVVDATGHPAELLHMLERKDAEWNLGAIGEGFMDVESGEEGVVEYTGEVFPGLYVAGMSVCAAYNQPRMGPIFGGMLKSGKKVADQIEHALEEKAE